MYTVSFFHQLFKQMMCLYWWYLVYYRYFIIFLGDSTFRKLTLTKIKIWPCAFFRHTLYIWHKVVIFETVHHIWLYNLQINYYLYQNESQSHIIINKRRYQIKTLDLKIRTNFHNLSVHWFQIVSKWWLKDHFLAIVLILFHPSDLQEFILMETDP